MTTTFENFDAFVVRQSRFAPRMPDIVTEFWERVRRRLDERRTAAVLSRLSPRRLRDMGFEPGHIYDAVKGTWDEVAPGRYRDDI